MLRRTFARCSSCHSWYSSLHSACARIVQYESPRYLERFPTVADNCTLWIARDDAQMIEVSVRKKSPP